MRAPVRFARIFLLILLSVSLCTVARAGTVHGTVRNGTTGKPAPGVPVMLIQLEGGMQPVANVQSGPQGEFSFNNSNIGVQPMLIRAVYHGINFHQPLPPRPTDTVDVSVFEPTTDPKSVAVAGRIVFFQPNGSTLIVGEEYSIENKSQPPQAYFRSDGNFEFSVPEGAQLQQIAAAGPAGMPVVQAPIDKTKGHFAIAYAFRPGESTIRYSYELPYPNNTASVKIPGSTWLVNRLLVVTPPSVQVAGEGLQSAGLEQGMSVYQRENLAANTTVAVNLSGTAPAVNAGNQDPQGGGSGGGQDAQGASASANLQNVPGRLDVLKWPLIAGFIGIFAVGAILLARKPVPVTVAAVPMEAAYTASPKTSQQIFSVGSTAPAVSNVPVAAALSNGSASPLETANAAVSSSLEYLKEQLFRLELRHQAGTISDEEYTTERARAEKVLRDLVRG